VRSQPNALALVVCVELASLHAYPDSARDTIVAASLFADGAGAALVGIPTTADNHYFVLNDFHTIIKPETEEAMAWQIGNHGFTLRLSPRVPIHLADVAPTALAQLFPQDQPGFWAIHPGGRAIVERLAKIFALTPAQVAPTLTVLRDYGNMSSATILFVLAELQRRRQEADLDPDVAREQQAGVAMAFGPGLVVEMARLTYVDRTQSPQNGRHNGVVYAGRQRQ
jgi:predicted naringenin-chalcone synthase